MHTYIRMLRLRRAGNRRFRPMHTKSLIALRSALHLLFASGLLLGLWAAGNAHAELKKDLIEVPLIKKFKEEKAAAAAEAAAAAAAPAHKRPAEKA